MPIDIKSIKSIKSIIERAGHPKRKKLGRGLRDRVWGDHSVLFLVKICPQCVQTTALFMSGTFYGMSKFKADTFVCVRKQTQNCVLSTRVN